MANVIPAFDLSLGLAEEAQTPQPDPMPSANQPENAELGPDGMPIACFVAEGPSQGLSPHERIEELFRKMRPCRDTLLHIVGACRKPMRVGDVNRLIDELQRTNHSVFSAADLCHLLQRAGALVLVDAQGQPFERSEPNVTDDGTGTNRLAASQPPIAHWLATPDGIAALEADDPLGRTRSLFEVDPHYLPIYKCVLALCARSEGARTPAIGAAVNGHGLLQRPRLFATYFIDRLERCGAIAWTGSWTATDAGLHALETLHDVENVEISPDIDDARAPEVNYDWQAVE